MPNDMYLLQPFSHQRVSMYLCLLVLGLSAVCGLLSRERRELLTRTCDKKFCVLDKHTACLQRSEKVKAVGISEEDQALIVSEHNRYRSAIEPTAANMMKMSWDYELAEIAQVWAETCQFSHDRSMERSVPGKFSAGQNLAMGQVNWKNVMRDWHNEIEHFVYGSHFSSGVGHFTQMVWATSVKIGCGYALCDDKPIYVCNYGPAGNSYNKQPYKLGKPCADCPRYCTNNLCDCGRKVCMNGGTMDLMTCTCICAKYHHVGPQCGLDCSLVEEPRYCGKSTHDWAGCQRYYNVPYSCPITCRACPYADYKYRNCGLKRKRLIDEL